jgi:hypothetical protein
MAEEQEADEKKKIRIKYGNIISISHFEDHNSFICANGFSSNDVLLRNFKFLKPNTDSTYK